jgi:hypothetical protein
VGTPARCEANERASCLQGPLAIRLVPDRDPKLHCIGPFSISQATSLVTAWRGLTRPLLVRTLSCGAVIKMAIHTRALRHLPPNTLDLLAKGRHDSFLFLCIQLLSLNVGADPPDVYLRRPMKCADLSASVSRFRRSWASMVSHSPCQKRLSHTQHCAPAVVPPS